MNTNQNGQLTFPKSHSPTHMMMNTGGIGSSNRPISWPSRTSVSASGKRIQTEISELNTDPTVDSSASPKGDNLYHWIATIIGPPGLLSLPYISDF